MYINYMRACILHLTNKIDTYYSCTHATFSSIDCVRGPKVVSSNINESDLCSKR